MEYETCGVCGGDGRVGNSLGGDSARCPSCRGTGRRSFEPLWHDVTKTKPSHHRNPASAKPPPKRDEPTTPGGVTLATEVKASALSDTEKSKLLREIVEYEESHGRCTQTFTKKVRKQLRVS